MRFVLCHSRQAACISTDSGLGQQVALSLVHAFIDSYPQDKFYVLKWVNRLFDHYSCYSLSDVKNELLLLWQQYCICDVIINPPPGTLHRPQVQSSYFFRNVPTFLSSALCADIIPLLRQKFKMYVTYALITIFHLTGWYFQPCVSIEVETTGFVALYTVEQFSYQHMLP